MRYIEDPHFRLDQARLLAAVVEFSDDAIITKDLDGIITSWNQGAQRIFGYLAEDIVGKPVTILMPPDRVDEEVKILERLRRGERIDHYETIRRHKNGDLIDISLTVSPIKNDDGRVIGASKIARDITDRRRSDTQLATLAREAEHRAKNMLANVQATVQLSQADTPEGLKRVIEGRLQALANAHRLFVESRWTGADIRRLVEEELAPYFRQGDKRARIEGPTVMMEPSAAQALAVVLHELATNAAKYGALSTSEGRLAVEWSRGSDDLLMLRWTESNGPAVTLPSRRGFGTRMMERMVAGQTKGAIKFDWRPEGVACEIAMAIGERTTFR